MKRLLVLCLLLAARAAFGQGSSTLLPGSVSVIDRVDNDAALALKPCSGDADQGENFGQHRYVDDFDVPQGGPVRLFRCFDDPHDSPDLGLGWHDVTPAGDVVAGTLAAGALMTSDGDKTISAGGPMTHDDTLDVSGDVTTFNLDLVGTSTAVLGFNVTGHNADFTLDSIGRLVYIADGSSALIAVQPTGNFGIGTASPQALIHALSTISAIARVEHNIVGGQPALQLKNLTPQQFNFLINGNDLIIQNATLGAVFPWGIDQLAPDGSWLLDANGVTNVLGMAIDGDVGPEGTLEVVRGTTETTGIAATFDGAIRIAERSTCPADPAEGLCIIWMSDGTCLGADGDLMATCTAGAVTNTRVFSAH